MKKILLLVLLISLMAYFYFEPGKESKVENRIFENIKAQELNQITIISDQNITKLKRVKAITDSWQLVQPIQSPVNKEFIALFNKFIAELSPDSVIVENEVEAKQSIYGLIPPQMVLMVEGDFGKEVYSLGKHVDFASARYLQKEKDPKIYLIKEDLFTLLSLDLTSIRSSKPIEFDSNQVQSIAAIPLGQPSYVIKKSSTASWILEASIGSFEADSKLLEQTLAKLANLEVVEFRDQEVEHLELFGLDHPLLTIRILLTEANANSKVLDLIFGKGVGKDSSYFMREVGKPTVYRIFRGAMSDWNRDVDYFRSRQLFTVAPDKLTINGKNMKLNSQIDLTKIQALSALNISAYKATEPHLSFEFSAGTGSKTLEIGDKLPSAGQDDKDSPSFVKINSENQQYVLILSAKDIEILKSLEQ